MSHRTTAIFPGSFDPLTNGHLDLIVRGAGFLDHLIVAVLQNSQKRPLFSVAERMQMISEATAGIGNVEVSSFDGLLVEYAAQRSANVILRGIRGAADYEVELQMAELNRRMRPETETIFLLAHAEHAFVSSRMVKEVITLGGEARPFVPETVWRYISAKFWQERYSES